MAIITQTPRVIIREFLPQEQQLFIDLMSDTRINAYLPKRNIEQMRQVFTETIAHYLQGVKLTRWGIFDVVTNDFMGLCLLKFVDDDPTKAELGYVLHLAHHGKGIATELCKALVTYGFESEGLQEIYAVTTHQNVPSQRVLLKAGLHQRKHITRGDEELSFFSISRQEYRGEQRL
jgi:ribosomal-protein-alanine N-acetyltransferase